MRAGGVRGLAARWRGVTRQAAVQLLVAASLLAYPLPLLAQRAPRIELRPPSSSASATVAARDVLSEKALDQLLRNGFPVRLQFLVELWTVGRWFDEVHDRADWDMIVRFDQVDRTYEVVRRTSEGVASLGSYAKFADARAASELAYMPALSLPASGRQGYITVHIDVQTLDITDLAEVQRWLQGEARPAVQGKRNPGTALTRGLRTLVSRLLGGEVRRLEGRSQILTF